jgi:uncharacterized integral membrane protein (TIGR00698 family)
VTLTVPSSLRTAVTGPATHRAAPGLALAGIGVTVAWTVHHEVPAVPMLTAAVVLGVAAAHLPGSRTFVHGPGRAGLSVAARSLMRVGIVLLGLQLSLSDVLGLGAKTVVMVLTVVAATLSGTWWLGRRMGLPGDQPLLIASGYSICGASAIGAVGQVTGSDEEDISASVTLVTLCGTLAIAVLPLLQQPLGLDDTQFGLWTGASVHDVGQVVATAQVAGAEALREAVLVKLIRVVMLAPLVAGLAVAVRRTRSTAGKGGAQPPIVPLFVIGFLAMIALRTTGQLPSPLLTSAHTLQELVLAAALFGLGSAARLQAMTRSGGRAATLGLVSWIVVAGLSYAGVLLTT